jgi:hypothetical protein
MNSTLKSIAKFFLGLFLLFTLLLISCYPKKKILARWTNGQLHIVRHYKFNDTADEKCVYYFDNRKKNYVEYWHSWYGPSFKRKEWYESGAKKSENLEKYKDTMTTFNLRDSSFSFRGLVKESYRLWDENGKLSHNTYSKNGYIIDFMYNNNKDSLIIDTLKRNIRPDGYDSIKYTYHRRKKSL